MVAGVADVKRLVRMVSQLQLILWTIEDCVAARKHAANRHDFVAHFVLVARAQRLRKHGIKREFRHLTPEFGELSSIVKRAQRVELLERSAARGPRRTHFRG